jgi:hypothetical protein
LATDRDETPHHHILQNSEESLPFPMKKEFAPSQKMFLIAVTFERIAIKIKWTSQVLLGHFQ